MAEWAVVRQAIRTSAGTQDFTSSRITAAPKWAVGVISRGVTEGAAAPHALLVVGVTDFTSSYCIGVRGDDNLATTSTGRWSRSTFLEGYDSSSTLIFTATVSTLSNGVRVTVGTAPASGYLLTIAMLGGTDVSAKVGIFDPASATLDVESVVSGVGFDPNTFVFVSGKKAFPSTAGSTYHMQFGVADYHSSTIRQYAVSQYVQNAQPDERAYLAMDDRYSIVEVFPVTAVAGTLRSAIELSSVGSGQFGLTPRILLETAMQTVYSAIRIDGLDSRAIAQTTKGSTGDQVVPVGGAYPQGGIMFATGATALQTPYANNQADCMGICLWDEDNGYTTLVTAKDAELDTIDKSIARAKALSLWSGTPAEIERAALSAVADGSFTLNYEVSASNAYFAGLVIPQIVPSGLVRRHRGQMTHGFTGLPGGFG